MTPVSGKLISGWALCILPWQIVFSKDGWNNMFHFTCSFTTWPCQPTRYSCSAWIWAKTVWSSSPSACKTRLERPCGFSLLFWDILFGDSQCPQKQTVMLQRPRVHPGYPRILFLPLVLEFHPCLLFLLNSTHCWGFLCCYIISLLVSCNSALSVYFYTYNVFSYAMF